MSIFDKPISALKISDVSELVAEKAVENVRLEFKREVPTKDETLKKLSSFANTFGGFMVIGAEANSSDGRIIGIPGVVAQNGFKQTIVQWCFGSVSPPLSVEISDPIPVDAGSDRVCYVLHVRESELAPHFLNGRKGLYVRTDEFSARFEARLATENEVRSLLDRRREVTARRTRLVERARQRFASLSKYRYAEFVREKKSIGAKIDVSVLPLFPACRLCDESTLLSMTKELLIPWRGVTFPRDSGDRLTQHESVVVLGAGSGFSLLEVNVWAMLFFAMELEEQNQYVKGSHLYQFVGNVLAFLEYARRALSRLGYIGSVYLEFRMSNMLGVQWVHALSGFRQDGPSSELDDEISFTLEFDTVDLVERINKVLADILRQVFFSTNFSEIGISPDRLKRVITDGYKFNNWKAPDLPI